MESLKLREKLGYGVGDLGSTLIFATVTTFLMYFYTDIFGLSAAAVGSVFFVARMIDAVSDPLMGAVADRTASRWGKFRPYLLFGAVPLGILAVLTFTTPELSDSGKLIYAYITYILLMVCYTVVNIPYSALPVMMSSDSKARTQLASFRMFCGFFAMLLVSGSTLPLVRLLGGDNEQQGFQLTIALFATLAVLLFFITFRSTNERVKSVDHQSSIKQDLKVVSQNRAWWVLLIVGVLCFSFTMMPFAVGMYYFRYNVGHTDMATAFFVSGNIGMLLGVVVTAVLSKSQCKKRMMICAQLLAALLIINFYWLDTSNIVMICGLFFLVMIAQGVSVPIMWSMVADAADYCEWKQGKRVIGLTTSSVTFSHKFGMGISGVITGAILTRYGYQAGAVQSADTLHGILIMMSLLPALGFLANALVLILYPIDKRISEQMQQELQLLRSTSS
ncbi:MFS transporter [Photobacterium sp. SDRW27]|uniref:MFS transporter n=1 Tax=Photobacterium obscurum TaxID=2829490 RepID=UPI002243D6DE|nr:MFS transporter [Photobacterium obscurum]MCW8329174.1 MFS transporter [Photobacterium obscurum]